MNNSIGAKKGHITRQISQDGKLSGKPLEFALKLIEENKGFSDQEFLDKLYKKISNGEKLDDYEQHILLDVILFWR